jgi:hypothetical protein
LNIVDSLLFHKSQISRPTPGICIILSRVHIFSIQSTQPLSLTGLVLWGMSSSLKKPLDITPLFVLLKPTGDNITSLFLGVPLPLHRNTATL